MCQSLMLSVWEGDGDLHCSVGACVHGNACAPIQLRRKEVGRSACVNGTCVACFEQDVGPDDLQGPLQTKVFFMILNKISVRLELLNSSSEEPGYR